MCNVAVIGVGSTPFGRHSDRTGRSLFADAASVALDDAGLTPDEVDALHYGNFIGALTERQGHQAPLMAEAVGTRAPATRHEQACASSGVAIHHAIQSIRAGSADVVLVGGMEKMSPLDTAETTEALATAADELHEVRPGMTFPGAYALMAQRYFDECGGTSEDLAHVAVKNHANALENEYAQFQRAITVADVLEAPRVASPLGLYDACPISDGASALVLAGEDVAPDAAYRITGTGLGTDALALQRRESLVETPATTDAARRALGMADRSIEEVDLLEVHDCFTIAEVLALEALGLYDRGEAAGAARRGETTAEGVMPVNLSGGLKAKGHPVGATGASQVVEVVKLLRGEHANSEAVPDATVGLAHNAGGTVASAAVHVVEER
ncbi:3-ketoacyl-CoA thiolase [Halarchaeum acidiphilum MH1-52-1]|uniref:3-ketoacyl-CoA thiolase n=1 Tax=Halarchaeum acidiphilum MH1-52-1 TaxID=1261545 RepID=U2YUS8_9EURY|nr:beta-ketoacyl synthase N-terminal-like domain-containing protein [Halarchaeum acidiphilum]GAD52522.1 3-ketoacyl-CoA thiolase [Halarchaeum acidiphilum MH1-52-1]